MPTGQSWENKENSVISTKMGSSIKDSAIISGSAFIPRPLNDKRNVVLELISPF